MYRQAVFILQRLLRAFCWTCEPHVRGLMAWGRQYIRNYCGASLLGSYGGGCRRCSAGHQRCQAAQSCGWRQATTPCGRTRGALGLAVWPAAPPLCRHLLRRSGGCMAGERVLELGSGTGVVGLFAAALGAATVLTDCRPAGPRGAAVLERLRSNAEANAALCAVAPELLELEWGHHEQQQAVASRGPFSLLLGSDVTYRPASHAALLAAAARVCECPEAGGSRPPPLLLAHHSWGTALPSMLDRPHGGPGRGGACQTARSSTCGRPRTTGAGPSRRWIVKARCPSSSWRGASDAPVALGGRAI
ncbi:unnamed protein product [Prorocentrum cordatum]|uniref:Calmodulin-lysine N-methyltransferase n=1 Tax=Prorocentrum cordatum TaxID=2364126 RepID=A0ABN9UYL2_9DINO|nr:unnamed protein product [Polarella glacialis]